MTPLDGFVLFLAILTLAGAGLVAWRGRGLSRTLPLVLLALLLTAVNLLFVAKSGGVVSPEAARAGGLSAAVLSYAWLPLAVLAVVGAPAHRDARLWIVLLGSGAVIAFAAHRAGYGPGQLFQTFPAMYYLAACLGIAAAVAASAFLQTTLSRLEGLLAFFAVAALIAAGPVYSYELATLGFTELLDANFGAPLAVLPLAVALLRGNPARTPRTPTIRGEIRRRFRLLPGSLVMVAERRPKYAFAMAWERYLTGRPVLLVTHEPDGRGAQTLAGVSLVRLGASRGDLSPSRLLSLANTVQAFLERSPNGVVLVEGLDYLLVHNHPDGVKEVLARLQGATRRTGGLGILPLSRLTDDEVSQLRALGPTVYAVPNVEDEVETVLTESLGNAGARILREFTAEREIRPEDLLLEDLPDLSEAVRRSLERFGEGAMEARLRSGWASQGDLVATRLMAYHDAELADLDAAAWRRAAPPEPVEEVDLTERVREVFAQHMGDAGRRLFETQVKQLLRGGALTREDLPALVERTRAALAAMADAIDVEAARDDFAQRSKRIGTEILRMAEVSG